MVVTAKVTCQVKSGLFGGCKAESIAQCQYCARFFCSEHAELIDRHESVCSRKFCVAKRRDLVKHLEYKAAVYARNEARHCGIEGCEYGLGGQCVRCQGYFCGRHVEAREETVLENTVRVSRMATLCHHCWARRPIWTRT